MDYVCRNCGYRFVPVYWIPTGGYGGTISDSSQVTGQCLRCGSNATEPSKEAEKDL